MADRVYRGEIYYIHETEVTGSEQTGGRPGIIISNDIGNEHSPVVIIVYLTTQEKKTLPTHVKSNTATKPSVALCGQIETIYKGRIGNYIGQITDTEQKNIDKALAVSIGIGIATKSGKFLETWAKAYTEEFPSSMAEALESVVSELEFEKQEEVMVEPEQNNRSEIHEEMIRLETERDVYKELYMKLLSDLSGGKQS